LQPVQRVLDARLNLLREIVERSTAERRLDLPTLAGRELLERVEVVKAGVYWRRRRHRHARCTKGSVGRIRARQ